MVIAAAVVPLLLLLALEVANSAREQRRQIENDALAQAKVVIAASDAVVARTLGALDVLSTAVTIREGDMPGARQRAVNIARVEPDWVAVIMSRAQDQALMFDTRVPFGATAPREDPSLPDRPQTTRVVRTGPGCPCVTLSKSASGKGGPYVVTVLLSTRPFERLLPPAHGRYEVSALVTREGIFVARSVNQAERVGEAGSKDLRKAVARGGATGSYRGFTLEGFENYTAFARSAIIGWSAHVALARRAVDAPHRRAIGSVALAGLISLGFAGLMIAFLMRQMAESRQITERMQQTQKLEALGQLTGGIAHDFNNLLTPIVGALDLLSKREGIDERARRIAASGLSSANRAAKLTGQLLAFSRQQKLSLKPVNLGNLLEDIRPLLEQSAGGDMRLALDVPEGSCWVETDPLQLELALLNLVINARDASEASDVIRVSATPDQYRGADAWRVVVADNGSGMSEGVKSRAFEPFFTTKQQGRGTGLGLAQVFAFARQSHGEAQIDSAPGAGTRVALLLPACPPGDGRSALAATAVPARSDSLDILVVDDQPEVRDTITLALEEDGHRVDVADSGAAALARLAEHSYALGVVDFAMPGMNGAELIAQAQMLYPDMRFLIVTGYLDSEAVEAAAPETPILPKPFDPETLRRTVRQLAGA